MTRPTALIIDDNEDDAFLISRLLRRNGFDTCCEYAKSPADVRRMLERQRWDLIICDYSFAGFDARDVSAMISEGRLAVPLVVVSGVDRETGEHEFVLKDDLPCLLPSIERARARVLLTATGPTDLGADDPRIRGRRQADAADCADAPA